MGIKKKNYIAKQLLVTMLVSSFWFQSPVYSKHQ